MARTQITVDTAPGLFSQTGVAVTMQAGDVANGNYAEMTEKMLVIAQNTDGVTPYNITLTSVADAATGRTGDATAEIAAGDFHMFRVNKPGWAQANGQLYIDVDNVAVEVAVIAL